ncbi:MAG: hypothetical protein HKN92_06280 [Chitinophagales bacterium]|nr:hypothetical protein [Chitinophagales bacterium]
MKKLIFPAILLFAIIIFLNLFSNEVFYRFDLTEDKEFTLSKASKDILKDLDETVTVKAYFSENLPPDVQKTKSDFQDLLIEYDNVSKGNVKYEFLNPLKDNESETEALQNGMQAVMINVREKDQVKQQKAFLGAVIMKGEQKEVIPFIQPGTAMEYALSTSIKKISVTDKPKIGIIQGHGEPPLNELQQVYANLNILYDVQTIDLGNSDLTPFKTLALIRPTDSIPASHLDALDRFLEDGKNLIVAYNQVEGDFQNNTGNAVETGLSKWLSRKNISVGNDFVLQAPPNCGAVTVQQQQGFFRYASQIPFPFVPIINRFPEHPITKGLESVVLQFVSSISFAGDSSIGFTPLVYTSKKSATMSAPVFFDFQKPWTENDFPLRKVTVGAIFSGIPSGNSSSKLILITDGDFPVSQQRGRQVQADNVSLLVNAIDWLSDDTGLIDLRTKGVTARPIKELPDSKRAYIKYRNFLLPILNVIVIGVLRAILRRRKRKQLLEINY